MFRSDTQPFFSSRHLIYSHLFAATAFLLSVRWLRDRRAMWPVTAALGVALLGVHAANHRYGAFALEREEYRLEERSDDYPDRERAEAITLDACQAGIYCGRGSALASPSPSVPARRR